MDYASKVKTKPERNEQPADSALSASPGSPPPFDPPKGSFQYELESLINCHCLEEGSDTPDFILAEYLRQCLDAFDMATRRREDWYRPKVQRCAPPVEENDEDRQPASE